jgi:hypothetical protein
MKLYIIPRVYSKRDSNSTFNHPYHLFISTAATQVVIKKIRLYWLLLLKTARHKSAQEFINLLKNKPFNKALLNQQLSKQTHNGWNILSKVARWQIDGKTFLDVFDQMDKSVLVSLLSKRNNNGANFLDLAARYQSPKAFRTFLTKTTQLVKIKNRLFNQYKKSLNFYYIIY